MGNYFKFLSRHKKAIRRQWKASTGNNSSGAENVVSVSDNRGEGGFPLFTFQIYSLLLSQW